MEIKAELMMTLNGVKVLIQPHIVKELSRAYLEGIQHCIQ